MNYLVIKPHNYEDNEEGEFYTENIEVFKTDSYDGAVAFKTNSKEECFIVITEDIKEVPKIYSHYVCCLKLIDGHTIILTKKDLLEHVINDYEFLNKSHKPGPTINKYHEVIFYSMESDYDAITQAKRWYHQWKIINEVVLLKDEGIEGLPDKFQNIVVSKRAIREQYNDLLVLVTGNIDFVSKKFIPVQIPTAKEAPKPEPKPAYKSAFKMSYSNEWNNDNVSIPVTATDIIIDSISNPPPANQNPQPPEPETPF